MQEDWSGKDKKRRGGKRLNEVQLQNQLGAAAAGSDVTPQPSIAPASASEQERAISELGDSLRRGLLSSTPLPTVLTDLQEPVEAPGSIVYPSSGHGSGARQMQQLVNPFRSPPPETVTVQERRRLASANMLDASRNGSGMGHSPTLSPASPLPSVPLPSNTFRPRGESSSMNLWQVSRRLRTMVKSVRAEEKASEARATVEDIKRRLRHSDVSALPPLEFPDRRLDRKRRSKRSKSHGMLSADHLRKAGEVQKGSRVMEISTNKVGTVTYVYEKYDGYQVEWDSGRGPVDISKHLVRLFTKRPRVPASSSSSRSKRASMVHQRPRKGSNASLVSQDGPQFPVESQMRTNRDNSKKLIERSKKMLEHLIMGYYDGKHHDAFETVDNLLAALETDVSISDKWYNDYYVVFKAMEQLLSETKATEASKSEGELYKHFEKLRQLFESAVREAGFHGAEVRRNYRKIANARSESRRGPARRQSRELVKTPSDPTSDADFVWTHGRPKEARPRLREFEEALSLEAVTHSHVGRPRQKNRQGLRPRSHSTGNVDERARSLSDSRAHRLEQDNDHDTLAALGRLDDIGNKVRSLARSLDDISARHIVPTNLRRGKRLDKRKRSFSVPQIPTAESVTAEMRIEREELVRSQYKYTLEQLKSSKDAQIAKLQEMLEQQLFHLDTGNLNMDNKRDETVTLIEDQYDEMIRDLQAKKSLAIAQVKTFHGQCQDRLTEGKQRALQTVSDAKQAILNRYSVSLKNLETIKDNAFKTLYVGGTLDGPILVRALKEQCDNILNRALVDSVKVKEMLERGFALDRFLKPVEGQQTNRYEEALKQAVRTLKQMHGALQALMERHQRTTRMMLSTNPQHYERINELERTQEQLLDLIRNYESRGAHILGRTGGRAGSTSYNVNVENHQGVSALDANRIKGLTSQCEDQNLLLRKYKEQIDRQNQRLLMLTTGKSSAEHRAQQLEDAYSSEQSSYSSDMKGKNKLIDQYRKQVEQMSGEMETLTRNIQKRTEMTADAKRLHSRELEERQDDISELKRKLAILRNLTLKTRKLRTWGQDQTHAWIKDTLAKYSDKLCPFIKNGLTLAKITHTLLEANGFHKVRDRNNIIRAVKRLKKEQEAMQGLSGHGILTAEPY